MGRILDLFINKYNYTDFHELNLDWIISDLRTLAETLENFISLNTIKYANPIQWNITTQYEANTVVIDANDGTAYLSVQPVPSGVALTNTDYWTPIFTLNLLSANQNITLRDDGSNILATFASNTDDWLIWNATLYKVSQPIAVNEAYVVGYNLDRYSVELFIQDYITVLNNAINAISANIGDLDDLTTTDKTTVVNAINELVTVINNIANTIGDLDDLATTDKTSVVNAINELVTTANNIINMIANLSLKSVDTVNDLIDLDCAAGDVVEVLGYYVKGDNGGARYIIQSTTETGMIALTNGLYARIINSTLRPEMFGCVCDGVTDDYTNFNVGLTYAVAHRLPMYIYGVMAINGTITMRSWLTIIGATAGATIDELGDVDMFYRVNDDNISFMTITHLRLRGNGNRIKNCFNFDNGTSPDYVGLGNCDIGYLAIEKFNMGFRIQNLWLSPILHDLDISNCNTAIYWAAFDGYLTNFHFWGCSGNLGAFYINGAINRFENGKVYLNDGGSQSGGIVMGISAIQNVLTGIDVQDNNKCGIFIQGTDNILNGIIGSHNNENEEASSHMIYMESSAKRNIIRASSRNPDATASKAHHYAINISGTENDIVMSSVNPKTANYSGTLTGNYVRINGSVLT